MDWSLVDPGMRRIRTCSRVVIAGVAALLLDACLGPTVPDEALRRLHLFDAAGAPRFAFYFSCTGEGPAETQMCWIPARYFSAWADARHVAIRELNDRDLDATTGIASAERMNEGNFRHRILVRFKPTALPSYTSEADGLGGYSPPKVGYQADVFVYSTSTGELEYQTILRKKTDAAYKADAVPYVKDGVRAVIAALDLDRS